MHHPIYRILVNALVSNSVSPHIVFFLKKMLLDTYGKAHLFAHVLASDSQSFWMSTLTISHLLLGLSLSGR